MAPHNEPPQPPPPTPIFCLSAKPLGRLYQHQHFSEVYRLFSRYFKSLALMCTSHTTFFSDGGVLGTAHSRGSKLFNWPHPRHHVSFTLSPHPPNPPARNLPTTPTECRACWTWPTVCPSVMFSCWHTASNSTKFPTHKLSTQFLDGKAVLQPTPLASCHSPHTDALQGHMCLYKF